MIEDITLHAYNEMINPIILCELSGKVIYKNPSATKQIRKPIKGGKIIDYLSRDSRSDFEKSVSEKSFPCFWEVESEGDLFSAFVDIVYYERRPVLFLVFSPGRCGVTVMGVLNGALPWGLPELGNQNKGPEQ